MLLPRSRMRSLVPFIATQKLTNRRIVIVVPEMDATDLVKSI
jgi:hypothetical protein